MHRSVLIGVSRLSCRPMDWYGSKSLKPLTVRPLPSQWVPTP